MSVLSAASGQKIEDILVSSGMIKAERLAEARVAATKAKEPLISYMLKSGFINDEQLTKANATITKVPYVNLTSARVDPAVLSLLPEEIASRYMAVPLGEIQQKLVVAMLDADNVQAVDYLSNRIGRPLKVYVASEVGIRQVLRQYSARLDTQMGAALMGRLETNSDGAQQAGDQAPGEVTSQSKNDSIKTIVQDSPISKALSAILEFAARNGASDVHIEPLRLERQSHLQAIANHLF